MQKILKKLQQSRKISVNYNKYIKEENDKKTEVIESMTHKDDL